MKSRLSPLIIALLLISSPVWALEIHVAASTQGKATLIINNATPKTLRIGQTHQDITLLSASAEGVEILHQGKKKRIPIGGSGRVGGGGPAQTEQAVHLTADERGHFWANLQINGTSVRGMIDTGATGVAFSEADARRLNLSYNNAPQRMASTAAGLVRTWIISVPELRFENVVLYDVPAAVLSGHFPAQPLIGNSLLNRMSMQKEGDQLKLIKRY